MSEPPWISEKYIKNPLTIIAVFAGLAEISGTGVLPLLSDSTQRIFVWFLMGFPCLLVLLFFWTLYTRHHVLYAPSDYRDESLFASTFERRTAVSRVRVLDQEIKEAIRQQEQMENASGETEIGAGCRRDVNLRALRANALLAQDLVLAKLSRELHIEFARDVSIRGRPNLRVDAIAITPTAITAVHAHSVPGSV